MLGGYCIVDHKYVIACLLVNSQSGGTYRFGLRQHRAVIPSRHFSLVVSPIMSLDTRISYGSHSGTQADFSSLYPRSANNQCKHNRNRTRNVTDSYKSNLLRQDSIREQVSLYPGHSFRIRDCNTQSKPWYPDNTDKDYYIST